MPRKRTVVDEGDENIRPDGVMFRAKNTKIPDRYYSDRTFMLCTFVSAYALLLCTFGRIDGGALIGILTFSVGGFITKRSLEGKNVFPKNVPSSDKE